MCRPVPDRASTGPALCSPQEVTVNGQMINDDACVDLQNSFGHTWSQIAIAKSQKITHHS